MRKTHFESFRYGKDAFILFPKGFGKSQAPIGTLELLDSTGGKNQTVPVLI